MSIKQILKNQYGIALISVALFVMVMGVLMFSAIYVLKTQSVVKSEQTNIDHAVTIEEAIDRFVAINNRYPCPAQMTAAPDDALGNFGVEARTGGVCDSAVLTQVAGRGGINVFIGTVPVRTLNIPEEMIADGNKQRYIFAVSGNMALDTTNPKYDQGAITILDTVGGTDLTTPNSSAVYALISPGADKRGSVDISGVASSQACPTSAQNADAHENCDFDDATFVARSGKVSGNTVADYTASVAFAVNPTAFNWVADPWQACVPADPNRPCFDGTQSRNVNCMNRDGTAGTAADCAHTPRPDDNRSCALAPCRWVASCDGGGCTPQPATEELSFSKSFELEHPQQECDIHNDRFGDVASEQIRNANTLDEIPESYGIIGRFSTTVNFSVRGNAQRGTVMATWSYIHETSGSASTRVDCTGQVNFDYTMETIPAVTCPTNEDPGNGMSESTPGVSDAGDGTGGGDYGGGAGSDGGGDGGGGNR